LQIKKESEIFHFVQWRFTTYLPENKYTIEKAHHELFVHLNVFCARAGWKTKESIRCPFLASRVSEM